MVARGKYGVGRDSFYALLEAMFGEQYISKPSFDMVTNQGSQGQFNDWLADSIWALVDETLSTDSNRYQRRHEAFEALKRNFEPATEAARHQAQIHGARDDAVRPRRHLRD